jgi:hypothetical protein
MKQSARVLADVGECLGCGDLIIGHSL